jgi:tetratricopeptide (TPR) repeat protein
LAAFLAYMNFVAGGRSRWYALSLGLFAVAILSKLSVVTLPLAVALWLWWRNGRLVQDDVVRLAPMLGLAAVVALADVVLVGKLQPRFAFSVLERVSIAGRALCFYTGKLVWPAELIPVYPRWTMDVGAAWQWVPTGAVLAAFTLAALTRRRLGRSPLAAAAYFVVTLGPMLGFVDHSFMEWSLVADRFQYLASIAPIALIVASAQRANELSSLRPWVAHVGRAGMLMVLGILTWHQAAIYTSPETYYDAIIAGNPDDAFAHYNLADDLLARGRIDEAIQHYEEMLRLRPGSADGCNNLANALVRRGRIDEAIQSYEKALRLHPDFVRARRNLAKVLFADGRIEESIHQYEEVLRLEPGNAEDHYNLAVALNARGRFDEAVLHHREAVRLNPDFSRPQPDHPRQSIE